LLGDVIAMETKNLQNLVLKHFDFLRQDYGFEHEKKSNSYKKNDFTIEVEHENGELNIIFKETKGKELFFVDIMTTLTGEEFLYPAHFSSWILSMGDVDSRLAYDAKLMKEYCNLLFHEDLKILKLLA